MIEKFETMAQAEKFEASNFSDGVSRVSDITDVSFVVTVDHTFEGNHFTSTAPITYNLVEGCYVRV